MISDMDMMYGALTLTAYGRNKTIRLTKMPRLRIRKAPNYHGIAAR